MTLPCAAAAFAGSVSPRPPASPAFSASSASSAAAAVSAGYSCFAGRLRARCFPRGSRYSPEPRSPRAVGSPCIRALFRLRFLEDPSVAASDVVSDIGRCRIAVLPLQASQCPHLRLRLPDDLHDARRVGGAGAGTLIFRPYGKYRIKCRDTLLPGGYLRGGISAVRLFYPSFRPGGMPSAAFFTMPRANPAKKSGIKSYIIGKNRNSRPLVVPCGLLSRCPVLNSFSAGQPFCGASPGIPTEPIF